LHETHPMAEARSDYAASLPGNRAAPWERARRGTGYTTSGSTVASMRVAVRCLLAAARWARCRYERRAAVVLAGIERRRFTRWDLLVAVAAAGGWEALAVGLLLEQPEVSALIPLV